MIMASDGMRTTVWVHPYKKDINNVYIVSTGNEVTVRSVDGHEESLVEIATPNGDSLVMRSDQLILAIKKCVFS